MKKAHIIATSAIEALQLAYQQNQDYHTRRLILTALARVTHMRGELTGMLHNNAVTSDPSEDCFPV